jgi:hypothetical protein
MEEKKRIEKRIGDDTSYASPKYIFVVHASPFDDNTINGAIKQSR